MKNIIFNGIKKNITTLIIFTVLSLSSHTAYSQTPQCNYHIQNSTDCTIDVTVNFYDSFGVCTSLTNSVLASNTPWFPNCGGTCGTIVDIEVILNNVGGCTPTGTGIVSSTNSTDSGGFVAPCLCGTSSNYSMNWYYNLTNIQ